jgi:cellobiose phosphorylase
MSFGHFSEDGSTYNVTTHNTPSSWSNYLFNDEYYMDVSQTLQGESSIVRDYTRENCTTGYRYFYVYDHGIKSVFSPNIVPLGKSSQSYECNHSLYATEISSSFQGIDTNIRVFVPAEGSREIWRIRLTNNTEKVKKLSFYSAFGFYDHGVMGGSCSYDLENHIITKYAFPYHTLYEEKAIVENKDSYTYMFSEEIPTSWDMSKRRFFGSDIINEVPAAILNEGCSGFNGEAEEFCGAMEHQFTIEAYSSVTFHLVLGVSKSPSDIIHVCYTHLKIPTICSLKITVVA